MPDAFCGFYCRQITERQVIMNTLTSKEQSHHQKRYVPVSYDRICKCCGNPFIAHDVRKIYCSKKCACVGYKRSIGQDSRLDPRELKCVVCGKEFRTHNPSQKTCSPECSKENEKRRIRPYRRDKRTEHTWEEYVSIQKEKAKQRHEIKKIEKIWYTAIHTVERECKYCGSLFYCIDTNNKQCCSSECSKKYENQKADKRIPKDQRIDKISLKRLYKRDNGICYLCGEICDLGDWRTSTKGNSYPGDKYPTIEHVIPISKGGLDAWDNVRLACWKCNLDKADGIIKMQPMSKEFAYSQKFSETQAKKTAQYTLDGQLIKIWNSTAQIERDLGLNSKHIQNVCRGDGSHTGNAYGYHWEYVKEYVV